MAKHAISVTLEHDNWVWLKGRTRLVGGRGISELLDQFVTEARRQTPGAPARSIAGTIDISDADPRLELADDALRRLFDASLAQPLAARQRRTSSSTPPRKVPRPAKKKRGRA